MMKRALHLVALGAALSFLGGCDFLTYRWNDLQDMTRLEIKTGYGLYAKARATDLIAAGGGYEAGYLLGSRGRYGGLWEAEHWGASFIFFTWDEWNLGEIRHSTWPQAFHLPLEKPMTLEGAAAWKKATHGAYVMNSADNSMQEAGHALYQRPAEIGGDGMFIMVGAGAGIDLLEVFDFVFGLLSFGGIDIQNDDKRPLPPPEAPKIAPAKKPMAENKPAPEAEAEPVTPQE